VIQREVHGDVAVLRLAHGKASALDLEFARELAAALEREAASDARALVLTGTGPIFSAGVDLVRLLHDGASYVREFLPAADACFDRLMTFEKPVVAAVNGHAIAGGCVFALACDHRVLARGTATIGVPELRVGVAFLPGAYAIARTRIPPRDQHVAITLGKVFGPEEALARGLVHELVLPELVLERALAVAEDLASIPARSFALHRRMLVAPYRAALAEPGFPSMDEVVAAWSSTEVQDAVRAYVARTLKK